MNNRTWFGLFGSDNSATIAFDEAIRTKSVMRGGGYSIICFGSYNQYHYTATRQLNSFSLYCAFPLHNWYENVINEFNAKFKNIQITVIKTKKYNEYSEPFDGTVLYYEDEPGYLKKGAKGEFVLMRMDINEEYNDLCKYFLPVIIGMFIRMHSFSLQFVPDDAKKDYIKDTIKRNNDWYLRQESAMSGFALTEEDFYALDNIVFMNDTFKKSYSSVKYFDGANAISIGSQVKPYCIYYVIDCTINNNVIAKYGDDVDDDDYDEEDED
jgi:hypothetical protein